MKFILFATVSSLTLSSCANIENVESKMSRYSPKTVGKNLVPEIEIADVEFKHSKNQTRLPASTNPELMPKTGSNVAPAELEGISNKKLYFMSLYGQYESMKLHASKYYAPEINICPHFHSGILEHKDKKIGNGSVQTNAINFNYDKDLLKEISYTREFPELYLPLSKDDVKPKVIDHLLAHFDKLTRDQVNEFVHQAIDIHLSKTYTEIRELCEYGVSDNYFIYENLITHIKNNEFTAGKENLRILLKTTLFSNTVLINSLEKKSSGQNGRTIASLKTEQTPSKLKKINYAQEIIKRLNVSWASDYFTKSNE